MEGYHKNLERILGVAKASLFEWDVPQGRIRFTGRLDCLGWERVREMTAEVWLRQVAPGEFATVREMLRRCLNGGQDTFMFDVHMRSVDGRWARIQHSGTVLSRDSNGRANLVTGMQQDVSQVNPFEIKLDDHSFQMDIMAELSDQVYWHLNTQVNNELIFSRQLESKFGYQPEEFKRGFESWLNVVHPEDRAATQNALADYISGIANAFRVELRMRHKLGHYLWVIMSGKIVQWDGGKPTRLFGGLLNINHIKVTENILHALLDDNKSAHQTLQQAYIKLSTDLEHSQARLHRQSVLTQVVNTVATQLLLVSEDAFDDCVIECLRRIGESVAADRIYIMEVVNRDSEPGLSPTYQWRMGGDPIWGKDKVFSNKAFEGWWERLVANEPINCNARTTEKESMSFFNDLGVKSVLIVPLHIENQFWGVVYYADTQKNRISDNSEFKILQASGYFIALSILRHNAMVQRADAVRKAQASAKAKSGFLANMSHEMRTPLNGIIGMTELSKGSDDLAYIKQCLDRVSTSAAHLLSIINDVLDMSKIEAGKMELSVDRLSIGSLVDDINKIIDYQAKQKNLTFRVFKDRDMPDVVVADRKRLMQVLMNLLINAVKFTPEHGSVCLIIRNKGIIDGNLSLYFEVRDTGIGISPEHQRKLFEAFYQADGGTSRRYGGTGLGLSISQNLVGLMGGTIQIISQQSVGSRFFYTISVPVDTSQQSEGHDSSPSADYTGILAGKRILMAEDVLINREVMISLLETTGVEIDTVEDGQSAVDRFLADPSRYHLILMDINMPVLDGYQATAALRSSDIPEAREVPIIAMTANVFKEDVEKCLEAGMNGHIGKPVNLEEVVSAILKALP